MVIQVIESRYTVDYDVLTAYLQSIFESHPFEIIVCAPPKSRLIETLLTEAAQLPDEGEKWKVNAPWELSRVSRCVSSNMPHSRVINSSSEQDQLLELQRKFRDALTGAGS
jgi:hypothetical protein